MSFSRWQPRWQIAMCSGLMAGFLAAGIERAEAVDSLERRVVGRGVVVQPRKMQTVSDVVASFMNSRVMRPRGTPLNLEYATSRLRYFIGGEALAGGGSQNGFFAGDSFQTVLRHEQRTGNGRGIRLLGVAGLESEPQKNQLAWLEIRAVSKDVLQVLYQHQERDLSDNVYSVDLPGLLRRGPRGARQMTSVTLAPGWSRNTWTSFNTENRVGTWIEVVTYRPPDLLSFDEMGTSGLRVMSRSGSKEVAYEAFTADSPTPPSVISAPIAQGFMEKWREWKRTYRPESLPGILRTPSMRSSVQELIRKIKPLLLAGEAIAADAGQRGRP